MYIVNKIKSNFSIVKLLVKKMGLYGSIKAVSEDLFFDLKNKIDTLSAVATEDLSLEENADLSLCSRYVPSFASCVRDVLGKLEPKIDFSSGNLVDMGSGKGKILFVAAEYGFKKIIGIEYSKDLHDICEKNIKKMDASDRVFSINIDGSQYKPEEDNLIYYFFNPFKGQLLDDCLKNICCGDVPFNGYLVYASPHDSLIFEKYANKIDDFRTSYGVHIEIYRPKGSGQGTCMK
jgi:16S rRNA G966 N2-methylase RsmD